MTETSAARAWIGEILSAAGLQGGGSVWRIRGPEVQWVIHIDSLPYGRRLGVDIGLDLQSVSTPRRPTDCAILIHLENLPVARDFAVVASLDLDSDLDPDRRQRELVGAIEALADYLTGHLTLQAVRAAFRAGDLSSAFIRKDARATLEAGDSP